MILLLDTMSIEVFISRRPQTKTLAVIEQANAIVVEYVQQGAVAQNWTEIEYLLRSYR